MKKFNKQELISNHPNCTCISPKLNSIKPILCSKLGMHPTEAEGQKPVSGIMQVVKMQKGILSGKRHNANRQNGKRQTVASRHNAKRHKANRHNACDCTLSPVLLSFFDLSIAFELLYWRKAFDCITEVCPN